ncbi:phage antirepressor [Ligilactobacillus ceti]|uniref:Antirepressor n=1 Tax=Ligilactobacillus ceti DSM 22408 TaxID=1122146 RepID=A0A0R2KH25_9LACO|nr:phage antirepressor KilAC domain-containing protein [Ligilactobacillus ceti]KRN88690.1 antirepressor [Ligilactobacillus ceti DSM 22408]
MTKLQVFQNAEFGTLRAIEKDGKVWFIGKEVADALGYTNTQKAIRDHVDIEDRLGERIVLSGQNRQVILINESGIYSLIFSSKLEKAKEFKHWVTSEVLPSIRKNGGYIKGQERLSNEELLSKALLVANNVIEAKNKQIAYLEPKALFADSVTASNTTILIGELAKILKGNGIEIGQNRLFDWLRSNGYLIKRKGTDYNMPTQKSMELGLFKIKETTITHSDGHTTISKTTKVTGYGQQYFINLFLKGGEK